MQTPAIGLPQLPTEQQCKVLYQLLDWITSNKRKQVHFQNLHSV